MPDAIQGYGAGGSELDSVKRHFVALTVEPVESPEKALARPIPQHEVAGNTQGSRHMIVLTVSLGPLGHARGALFARRLIAWKGGQGVALELFETRGERHSVLDGKGCSLREIGENGMGGIAKERDPAARP